MALFTSDWNPLGKDIFYRKFELYPMSWFNEININDYTITASPFGGPIALIRDEKKVQMRGGISKSTKPIILIYSSNGKPISSIKWNGSEIALLSWSNREDLICIEDDGVVMVYDIYANLQNTFTLDQEIRDTKIMECRTFQCIHGTGVAILTCSLRFFVLNNIRDPKIRRLAEVPGLVSPPSAWNVITSSKETQLIVAKDSQLYLLNSNDHSCNLLSPYFSTSFGSIIEISLSFDSSRIALLTDNGILWMGETSDDLKLNYCEFETKSKTKPQHLLWCGNGAVVGLWKNVLLAVGPERDWLNYVIDGPVYMVSEIDGVRIIGNDTQELLQRVPPVVVDIFRIGSISAGALLLEASKEFRRHSHKADEYIRMIRERNEIEISVRQCIEAAGHEYSVSTQKMLLRAASFGKCFVPNMDPEPFVNMCQTLRVLNAIRNYDISLPITYEQLQFLTMPIVLDRLILRRFFCLAISIAKYLKMPDQKGAARILAHWACYKVKQNLYDDERIAREISNKLGYSPGVSYSEVANKAIECGKTNLAIRLLDHELRATEQVPLLLKLKQHRQGIQKAIESGDTDLIYTVIIRLREVLPAREFPMVIRNYPIAYSLYLKYCKDEEKEKWRDMFYQEDDFQSEGCCWITESQSANSVAQRQSCLQSSLDCFRKAKNDFSVSVIDEHSKLIKYQMKLHEKFNRQYLDLSLHQTMQRLLIEKEHKLCEEMKKEFKVPEKRFWWLKMIVLADDGDWGELEKFSKLKKSPIGYEPFVDICLKHKNRYEAQKYLSRVKDENKVTYYVKAGMLEDAAKVAFEAKDDDALNYVLSKCGAANRMVAERINLMKSQLRK